jgi:hypothetical protein
MEIGHPGAARLPDELHGPGSPQRLLRGQLESGIQIMGRSGSNNQQLPSHGSLPPGRAFVEHLDELLHMLSGRDAISARDLIAELEPHRRLIPGFPATSAGPGQR